uniref:Tripartite motif-containing protein 16-like n=1 Tax=Cyprinus carpio carpio TaxID=630221 RepID=A0A9J7XYX6_CYPCA
MAEVSFSQDQFSCPVCLDLLKDPVAIPCGHSYCMSCITECWDQKDQKGVYSCPQCRQTFTPRPALNKNTILAEVVEQLKKTKLQAGPENVESDVCTRRKCKSVKSRQSFQSLAVYPESADEPNITVSSLLSYDDLRKSVSQLKEKLEDFCQEEIEKISGRVTCVEINPTNEPKIREEFLQYSSWFTLDPNTVNKHLCLSERNRAVTFTAGVQQYPDHPDRFHYFPQVLCRESVCGRCYWELEWSGSGFVCISVSYIYINRKGRRNESVFGYNDQSWSLICSTSRCSFSHNDNHTELPELFSGCRIGVYVDHRAGTLSFYSVSDTMSLIHRVQTTFTHPLYPGFAVISGSAVKLCDP